MNTLVVSDLHLGRVGLGENALSREKKSIAVEAIATYLQERRDLALVLLGDIFHRPDGHSPNPGEGFDRRDAMRQVGPLAEVLRSGDHAVSYVPGNCDPWADGSHAEKAQLDQLIGQEEGRVAYPGFVIDEDGVVMTHGHAFTPGIPTVLRELVGFPGKNAGVELRDAMAGGDAFRERAKEGDAKGGSHHLAFRLKTLVFDGVLSLPVLRLAKESLLVRARRAWDASYRRAFSDQAAAFVPDAHTLVMGHTHMPGIRLTGGRTFVNSGSAGADNTEDGNGTVALLKDDEAPELLWSVHRDVAPGNLEPRA